MKAHINGITVEGTPQEIMEYQRLQGEKKAAGTIDQRALQREIDDIQQRLGSGTAVLAGRCPNEGHACFCTGACHGNNASWNLASFVLK